MLYYLYVVFDRLSGIYGAPMVQVNDACALRAFNGSLSGQFGFATDYELYKVGSFDSATGVINLCDKIFIARGEADEKTAQK